MDPDMINCVSLRIQLDKIKLINKIPSNAIQQQTRVNARYGRSKKCINAVVKCLHHMKLIVPQIFQTERLDCLIEYHQTLMSKNCSTVVREQASNFEVEGSNPASCWREIAQQLLVGIQPRLAANIYFFTRVLRKVDRHFLVTSMNRAQSLKSSKPISYAENML